MALYLGTKFIAGGDVNSIANITAEKVVQQLSSSMADPTFVYFADTDEVAVRYWQGEVTNELMAEATGEHVVQRVELGQQVTSIGPGAFNGSPAREVSHKGVAAVAAAAFKNSDLTSFDFSGVRTVGEEAFKNSGIKDAGFGPELEDLGERAFQNCSYLTSLAFGECRGKLKTIKLETFEDCVGLSHVVLPISLTAIEAGAFRGCTSFFCSLDVGRMYIPAELSAPDEYEETYPSGKFALSPSGKIKKIGAEAFRGCNGGRSEFQLANLGTVEEIGWKAFAENPNLNELHLWGKTQAQVESMAYYGLWGVNSVRAFPGRYCWDESLL